MTQEIGLRNDQKFGFTNDGQFVVSTYNAQIRDNSGNLVNDGVNNYRVKTFENGDAAYNAATRVLEKAEDLKQTAWANRTDIHGKKMNSRVIDAIDSALKNGSVYTSTHLHGGMYNVDNDTIMIGTASDNDSRIMGLIAHEGTHYYQDTAAHVNPMSQYSEYDAFSAQYAVENGEAEHILKANEILKINNAYGFAGDAQEIHNSLQAQSGNSWDMGDGSVHANPTTTAEIVAAYEREYNRKPTANELNRLVYLAAQHVKYSGGYDSLQSVASDVVKNDAYMDLASPMANLTTFNALDVPGAGVFTPDSGSNVAYMEMNVGNPVTRYTGEPDSGGKSFVANDPDTGVRTSAEKLEHLREEVNELLGSNLDSIPGYNIAYNNLPRNIKDLIDNIDNLNEAQLNALKKFINGTGKETVKILLNEGGSEWVKLQPLKTLAKQTGRQTRVNEHDNEPIYGSYDKYKKHMAEFYPDQPTPSARQYVDEVGKYRVYGKDANGVPTVFTACSVMSQMAVVFGNSLQQLSESERIKFAKWTRYRGLVGVEKKMSDEKPEDYEGRIHGEAEHKKIHKGFEKLKTGKDLSKTDKKLHKRLCEVFPEYKDIKTRKRFIQKLKNGENIEDARGRKLTTNIGENQYPKMQGNTRNINLGNQQHKGHTYYYSPGDMRNVRDGAAATATDYNKRYGHNLPILPKINGYYCNNFTTLTKKLNKLEQEMTNCAILIDTAHYVKVVGTDSDGQILVKDSNESQQTRVLPEYEWKENKQGKWVKKFHYYSIFNYTQKK